MSLPKDSQHDNLQDNAIRSNFQIAMRIVAQEFKIAWSEFTKRIPGTKEFKNKTITHIIDDAKIRRQSLLNLSIYDDKTKHHLLRAIRKYQNRLAIVSGQAAVLDRTMTFLYFFLSILIIFATPFVINAIIFNRDVAFVAVLAFVSLLVSPLCVAIFLVPLALIRSLTLFSRRLVLLINLCWPLIVFSASAGIFNNINPLLQTTDIQFLAVTILLTVNLFTLMLYSVAVYIPGVWGLIAKYRIMSQLPHHRIIDIALHVLSQLESNQTRWADVQFRHGILMGLEDIARTIEKDLPKQLATNDEVTDSWFKSKCERIAATIRDRKRWILTPMRDTREHLIAWVAESFVYMANGSWHYFPESDVSKIVNSKWYSRVFVFLRTLLIALLPIIAIQLIQGTPYAVTDTTILNYGRFGGIIWCCIVLMTFLDPSISSTAAILLNETNILKNLPFGTLSKKRSSDDIVV